MAARAHTPTRMRGRLLARIVVSLCVLAAAAGLAPQSVHASAAAPVTWMSGFEHGSASTSGAGAFGSITGTAPVLNGASARTGNYGVRCNTATTCSYGWAAPTGASVLTLRTAIRLNALPSNKIHIFGAVGTGGDYIELMVQPSGALSASFRGSGIQLGEVAGPMLNTAQWYVLEFRADMSSNPWRVHWQVDGVNQTPSTLAHAPDTIAGYGIAADRVGGGNVTADLAFDDMAVSRDPFAFPLGDGEIIPLTVSGQGTHVSSGSFLNNGGGGINGTSHTRVDDLPMTSTADWVYQAPNNGSAYLEWQLSNPGRTDTARAVQGLVAYRSATTSSNDAQTLLRSATGTTTSLWLDNSETTLHLRSRLASPPTAGWTESELNGTVLRTGFASDASPDPYWDSLLVEVEYPVPGPVPAPGAQYTHATDASAGTTNPTAIATANPHLSWRNNSGEAVDGQRVQVAGPATPSDVIAHWRFDGDVRDVSGNGHHGTLGGSPMDPEYVTGKSGFGSAMYFDGASSTNGDHVSVPHDSDFDLSGDFSIELWYRSTGPYPTNENGMISKCAEDAGGVTFEFQLDNGGTGNPGDLLFFFGDHTSILDYTTNTADGNWHHAVATHVGSSDLTTLYVDGVARDSSSSLEPINYCNDDVFLGNESPGQSGGDNPYRGDLDDVRILSRVLTASEVAATWAAGAPATYSEGPGDVLWDSSWSDLGQPLDAACADAARCEDIVFDVDGNAGSATPLDLDGTRYFARAKYQTQAGNLWSNWSSWDWFETATLGAGPDGQFTGNAAAQSGATNPTNIYSATPSFSWVNVEGEAVDAQRVQVAEVHNDDSAEVVAHWRFDGDFTDETPDSYTLTPAGGASSPTFVAGQTGFGQAGNFDGADRAERATGAEFNLDNDFTVESWFRWDGGGGVVGNLLGKNAAGDDALFNYGLWVDSGVIRGGVTRSGTQYNLGGTSVMDGQWHHVALTMDGANNLRLYLDGTLNAGPVAVGGPATTYGSLVVVGAVDDSPYQDYWNGRVDDLRITARARTAAEIADIWTASAPPPFNTSSMSAPFWDSNPGDTGEALDAACAHAARCEDIVFNVDGNAGSATPLVNDGTRYAARAKFQRQSDSGWTAWSDWDWFETIGGPPAPGAMYVDDSNASAGSTNPTGITNDDHHYSWVNNAGATVDRQRVQVVNTPLDDVVGLWRLDGDVTDSSGNGLDGSRDGAAAQPTYIPAQAGFGQALAFDGGDGASVPHDPALDLSVFTVDAWFRTSDISSGSAYPEIVQKAVGCSNPDPCNFEIFFGRDGDFLAACVSVSGNEECVGQGPATSQVVDGQWHHVALTVTATEVMQLYVDGEPWGDPLTLSGPPDTPAVPIGIGRGSLGSGNFDGDIDEVRISSAAMTADEVAGYYATMAPHFTTVWDSDTGDTGVALGSSCGDSARCADVAYGATGSPEELVFGGARYHTRGKFRTQGSGTWSEWSAWDWFETADTASVDLSDCGTAGVVDLGTVLAGQPTVGAATCSIGFGSSGASTMLRLYQADGGGVAAWSPSRGVVDTTFSDGDGSDGVAFADFAGQAESTRALVALNDGRVVVGGSTLGASEAAAVAIYHADGSPDLGFDGTGQSTRGFAAGDDSVRSIAIQPDGKIVLCASNGPPARFTIMRMTANGAVDTTFSGDGVEQPSFNTTEWCADTAIAPDGSIVSVGGTWDTVDNDIAVARHHPDGSPDDNFDGNGEYVHDFGGANGREGATALSVMDDGRFVVGANSEALDDIIIGRMNPDGTVDNSFGGGWDNHDFGGDDSVADLEVLPDGRVMLFGSVDNGGRDFLVARFLSNGSLDPTFNGGLGYRITPIGAGDDIGFDGTVLPGGDVVVAGLVDGANPDVAVVAVRADGTLNTEFGTAGIATYDIAGGADEARAIALTRDGDLVVAGTAANGTDDMFVLRLDQNGAIADYTDATTDWDTGTSMFAACLESLGAGTTDDVDTWTVDPGNDCAPDDSNEWNAIAPDGTDPESKVAASTGPGVTSASVDLRFGMRVDPATPTGTEFVAPMIAEVVSPNL